jgi:hypothetical protein
MRQLLHGSAGEIAKGKIGFLRKMREDADGNLIRCPCRSDITDEPDRDFHCPYCLGHGYFWDEHKIVYYRDDDSFNDGEDKEGTAYSFYFEWDEDILKYDFIIEVELDKEGKPVQPINRQKVYDIVTASAFRADNGRVEFWHVKAKELRKWSVWYGVQHRQFT